MPNFRQEATASYANKLLYAFIIYSAIIWVLFYLLTESSLSDFVSDSIYLISGLGSLIVLRIIVSRDNIPLPFLQEMSLTRFVGVTAISLASVVVMEYAISPIFHVPYPFLTSYPDTLHFVIRLLDYVFVGITEESSKVGLTNILAWRFRKSKRETRRNTVVVAGVFSVAVWAYEHVVFSQYSVLSVFILFLFGIILFCITYRFKNYLPAIVTHIVWDLFFH